MEVMWGCGGEVSLYLVDFFRIGVECLEVNCELRLICL
ncbi:hypothetical protein A2U01_0063868, partial [Trifolium medium]|nr:hypothetical protein [Trifolium medium]